MPLRRAKPLVFTPRGVCDALDGTPVPPGAMAQLANLIPDPSTESVFMPRPAAARLTTFASFLAPGFISARLVVGDTEYGLIASNLNPGFDQPYAYDLANNAFLTVGGITAANVPASPPTSGDWTPPILAQVASRVIVTHPGFDGTINKIGWFDVSGVNLLVVGDTVSGLPYIYGGPAVLALQPGMTVSGTGIPAGATVLRTYPNTQSVATFTGDSHATNIIDNLSSAAEMFVGKTVSGPGVQAGSTVVSFTGSSVTLSLPTTSAVTAGTFTIAGNVSPAYSGTFTSGNPSVLVADTTDLFIGQLVAGASIPSGTYISAIVPNTSITMTQDAVASGAAPFLASGNVIELSANATATNNAVALTVAGGTRTAPLWGAGDTDITPLAAQPVSVAGFNARAYYALGELGIQYSDSGFPTRISNSLAVQALTPADGLAVTALGQLGVAAPLTGGIVQGLIAFQGTTAMQQILGDQSTSNLSMNRLQAPQGTGTDSPLSICATDKGLLYISPQGMRVIDFNGRVSPVIGVRGRGISVPFIFALYPSRICAAANVDIYRVTVQRGDQVDQPTNEWWYHLAIEAQQWTGPHSFTASLIEPWRNTFVVSPAGIPATLWESDGYANNASSYTENGVAMTWTYQPSPLPDTGEIAENSLVQMTLACAQASLSPITVVAGDISGQYLDTTVVDVPAPTIWGQFNWGHALWGGASTYQQLAVNWTVPLVFKQLNLSFTGSSNYNTKIGNIYMQYEILGYKLMRQGIS